MKITAFTKEISHSLVSHNFMHYTLLCIILVGYVRQIQMNFPGVHIIPSLYLLAILDSLAHSLILNILHTVVDCSSGIQLFGGFQNSSSI